jgi:predicted Zn-dependent protease
MRVRFHTLGIALGLCASLTWADDPARAVTVSPSKEVAWGQKMLAAFLDSRRLSEDAELSARLDTIGTRIVPVSDRPDLVYRFLVVEGQELQAYTFPGGAICFSEGLIRLYAGDDELAFALGHELAHVVLRHHASQLRLEQALEAGGKLPDGKLAPIRSFFDRTAEIEADTFGALYATRAGYAFSASHESLAKLARTGIPAEDESHPAFEERIRSLRTFREELALALRAFEAGVKALEAGEPDQAIPALELFVASFPNSPAGRTNLGAAYLARIRATSGTPENLAEVLPILPDPGVVLRGPLDRADLTRARDSFRHALEYDPEGPWPAAGLALVQAREGHLEESRELLTGVLERHPEKLEVLLDLGNVEFLAGRNEDAGRVYRKALDARPGWAEAQKNLALTLERGGDATAARALWQELTRHAVFGAEARLRLAASTPAR